MTESCPFEERLARVARRRPRGECLDPELSAHLEDCALCQDRLLVESTLAALAAPGPEHRPERMPDAGAIWRQHRREATRRALLPIRWAERLAWAGGAAGASIGLYLTFPSLRPLAAGPASTLGRALEGVLRAVGGGLSAGPLADQPSATLLLVAGLSVALGLVAAGLFSSLTGETI